MHKDLTRRTDLTKKSEQTKTERMHSKTEVERAQEVLAEGMLFGASPRPYDAGPPTIFLGIDCTASMGEYIKERRITPEVARSIAYSLFEQPGMRVRLAIFRGDGDGPAAKHPRQLRFSKGWYDTPEELAQAITKVEHWPGWTQHTRLLRHVVEEAEKQAIQRVVIISDAFERQTPLRPDGDDLMAARVYARRLRALGTKVVFGFKGIIRGGCPLDRGGINAEQAFRDIATEAGGYVFLLDPATAAGRFAEIATQATLAAKGDTAGAQKLIEYLQPMPFEMVVEERLPSARCAAQSAGSEEP
jgi:hypothetical protein